MRNSVRDDNGNTIEVEWVAGGLVVRTYSAASLEADEVGPPAARMTRKQSRWLAESILDAAGYVTTIEEPA